MIFQFETARKLTQGVHDWWIYNFLNQVKSELNQSTSIRVRPDNFDIHRIVYSEFEIHNQKVLDPQYRTQALGNLQNAK